jgi:RNA polymerase sigma-70 factor (family 1)
LIFSLFTNSGGGNKEISKEEFKIIFDSLYQPIRNFIYYKTIDIELSEDLAQDTFLKVWEKRHEVRTDSIKPLLYKIAENLALNAHKKQEVRFRFNSKHIQSQNNETPEYLMRLKEYDEMVQKALASLTEACREVFLMNRIDGLKYHEIAERLDISMKAVEKRMGRAIEELRQKIDFKF